MSAALRDCSNKCSCCHGIWKPTWGRDRILPGDTGRSWYFSNPATFAIMRVSFALVGVIFLLYSALTDKPPAPPDPNRFASGWFAYWKFYSNWTLALCSAYCLTAALFSYALWKLERNPRTRPVSGRYAWEMEVQVAHEHEEVDIDDVNHELVSGSNRRANSGGGEVSSVNLRERSVVSNTSPSRADVNRDGVDQNGNDSSRHHPEGTVELEEEDSPLAEPQRSPRRQHRPRRDSRHGRRRNSSDWSRTDGVEDAGTRRKISLGETCLWLMYQTVWAAAIFCACTFWVFIGIGCLPRKSCTSVSAKFWSAQVINLAFIVMELTFNKLPFIPFHSILTLGYCVLWLIFSAILWYVTGHWVYPKSTGHGQLYSAVTFWPGWIILNVGSFFIGLGVEWVLARWIFPTKHSLQEPVVEGPPELDIQMA